VPKNATHQFWRSSFGATPLLILFITGKRPKTMPTVQKLDYILAQLDISQHNRFVRRQAVDELDAFLEVPVFEHVERPTVGHAPGAQRPAKTLQVGVGGVGGDGIA